MELLQLRYFKDAAELENFSKVAEKNMVPQPSISKTIKKLESELNVKLFDRIGRKVTLNENGQYFYDQINDALQKIDDSVRHFKQPEHANITLYTQAGSRFVSLLIADFLTNTHNIFISTVQSLSNGKAPEYDFTFIQSQADMEKYNYIELMQDEIVAVIPNSNPLSKHKVLSIKDLASECFIGYYRSINLRDFTDNYCETYGGFTPNVVFETTDTVAIRYMLGKGKGITLAPQKTFCLQPLNDVSIIPLKEKTYRTLALAWKKNKFLSTSEKQFVDYCKKWFESII